MTMTRMMLALCALLLTCLPVTAETQLVGPYQVHFSAFESTFLSPDIAKQYRLSRSASRAVINVTVLDTRNNNAPTPVNLTGEAKNLLGHSVVLEFKEVKEQSAVYYLEQLDYSNEETFRFY